MSESAIGVVNQRGLQSASGRADRVGLVAPDSPAWQAALSRIPHDFYQLPAYAEFCAKLDGGTACAYLEDEGDFTFLAPLILLRVAARPDLLHASCPYGYPGPIATPKASAERVRSALARMRQSLAERGAVSSFSRLHPLLPLPDAEEAEGWSRVSHGQTVSIDLSVPLEQSFRDMRSTHRRYIARARRAEFKLHFSWNHLQEYQRCYNETMRRVGAAPRYFFGPDYELSLREVLREKLHLITLELDGEIACGGLFVEHNGIIQYHLGGTRDDYLPTSPAKLLFDEVRIWGHGRGNQILHLGGGVGGQGDSLLEFKSGFSQRRHEFSTLRMVNLPDAYRELCAELQVSNDLSSYFPPFALAESKDVPAPPLSS